MEQITAAMIFEFIALLGGGIAAWTKINQEVTLLKSRIINLEKRENDMAKKLDTLLDAVNELKILLAKKGI
jgi:prefoldin subunit 5|tara:strand:+ start:425 stop:637 length:213 start_codon:yes stop_codon:yes gene_type:complete